MIHVISVAKSYSHRGNHKHRSTTKKYWYLYYVAEEGNFKSKRINSIEVLYYKTQKRKRIKYICTECGNFFMGLVKSSKEQIDCPVCEN